jgi:predicted GTPase
MSSGKVLFVPESFHTLLFGEKEPEEESLSQYVTTLVTEEFGGKLKSGIKKGIRSLTVKDIKTISTVVAHELFSEDSNIMEKLIGKHNSDSITHVIDVVSDAIEYVTDVPDNDGVEMKDMSRSRKYFTGLDIVKKLAKNDMSMMSTSDILECIDMWSTISGARNEIRIMLVGRSQVGKTSTIKNLFGIDGIEIGNGMQSDTKSLVEHRVTSNDCTLIIIDTPGFFDSDGIDDTKTLEKLEEYSMEHYVDIFMFFEKMYEAPLATHMQVIENLTGVFGTDMWNRTVMCLTHANRNPSQEYYENYERELAERIKKERKERKTRHKISWKNRYLRKPYSITNPVNINGNYESYDMCDSDSDSDSDSSDDEFHITDFETPELTRINVMNDAHTMWKNKWMETVRIIAKLDENNMSVCLIENNKYDVTVKKGEYYLFNNQPVWVPAMEAILSHISHHEIPTITKLMGTNGTMTSEKIAKNKRKNKSAVKETDRNNMTAKAVKSQTRGSTKSSKKSGFCTIL